MRNCENKPILIVSLDFELFWGMQDRCQLADYQENVLGGRRAIPRLLSLFERYGIHATWATVGFMFADSLEELKQVLPDDVHRPSYKNTQLSPYPLLGHIGEDEEKAPCFFAPSLIRLVSETPGQEIGSHTFSHYYCREPGQTIEQFRADMKTAVTFAKKKGYTLKSLVFPRNQSRKEYIDVLKELGFTSYREEENDWIHKRLNWCGVCVRRLFRLLDVYLPLSGSGGYVPSVQNGLVNLPGSRMYKPFFKPLAFMETVKIRRIKKQMLHAAQKGLVFHLWWHPHNIGVRTDFHLAQLNEIFQYYSKLREKYGMQSMNMGEAAELVKGKRNA